MLPLLPPNHRQQAEFFSQLAATLDAGLSLGQALPLVCQAKSRRQKTYWVTVAQRLDQGLTFSEALALSPPAISPWTRTLLETAYESGALVPLCRQLSQRAWADHQRDRYRGSVLQSLVGVIGGTIVGLGALAQLPFLTIALTLILALAILASLITSPHLQTLRQSTPILGQYTEIQFALALTELALPLQCGLSILAALDLLNRHSPHPRLSHTLTTAARRIRQGQTLSEALGDQVPPLIQQYVRTGEESGSLDTLLLKIASYYDQELETLLRRTQGTLKPLSILGLGVIVLVLGMGMIQTLLSQLPL